MKVVVNAVMEHEMPVEIWKLLVVPLKKALTNTRHLTAIFTLSQQRQQLKLRCTTYLMQVKLLNQIIYMSLQSTFFGNTQFTIKWDLLNINCNDIIRLMRNLDKFKFRWKWSWNVHYEQCWNQNMQVWQF